MSTIDYYNNNAKTYFENTINVDMSDSYSLFLKYVLPNGLILDLGCGSGRDSKYFLDNNYHVECIDGSQELCKLASKYLNHDVKCVDFNDLNFVNKYDGVWACSSLLHVKRRELKNILIKIRNSLKTNGIFYISLKNGIDEEIQDGKYYNYVTYDNFKKIIEDIGSFDIIEYYETRSQIKINERKWNNFILRKVEV